MPETNQHAHETMIPPPNLRLVRESVDDERPEDTIVQGRGVLSGVMKLHREPDAQTLQQAFSDSEYQFKALPGDYQVAGNKMDGGNRALYRVSIVKPNDRGDEHSSGNSITTVVVGLAPDGSPHWEIQGDKLDDDFEMNLVDLMEDIIADVRRR